MKVGGTVLFPSFCLSSTLFCYSPPIVQAEGAGDSPRQTSTRRVRRREEFGSGAFPSGDFAFYYVSSDPPLHQLCDQTQEAFEILNDPVKRRVRRPFPK